MENVFLEFFNMSITASWLVLAVIVFRFIFKKAPKSFRVIMWGLVALRLVCPLSLESVLSIIPSTEFVPPEIVHSNSSADLSGAEIFNAIGNNQVYYDLGIQDGSVIFTEYSAPDGNTVNPLLIITYIASILWVVGMAVMLLYTLISYLRILKKVREATPLKENIWICDNISTPFILGLVKPRIFLPSSMNEQDTEFVIAHEKAHLKRRDHLWKPLGFALLTVYWFNPVLWVAYVLLCRDIELACDEKVIKEMGTEIKKSYSDALINCSVPRKMISACPLAFGETGVKGRIKSVLNYKKPAFWVIVVAVVAVLITTVCFMTNPEKDDDNPTQQENNIQEKYGITNLTNGSEYDGVSINFMSALFTGDSRHIEIEWNNETDRVIMFGEEIHIFKKNGTKWEECKLPENYGWHAIAYLLKADGTVTHKYGLSGYEEFISGEYRFETYFSFEENKDKDYKVWIEFEKISANIDGDKYTPVKLVYDCGIYSFYQPAEDAPTYYVLKDMSLIAQNKNDTVDKWGKLSKVSLNEDNWNSKFSVDAIWSEGYSLSQINENNKSAWQVKTENGDAYFLLEQNDGTYYIAVANKFNDDYAIRWIYLVEKNDIKINSEDTAKGEESTTESTTEESTTEESTTEETTTKAYVPTPLIPLSAQKATQIKQDYLKALIDSFGGPDKAGSYNDLTVDDVNIERYYGTYDNCIVLWIDLYDCYWSEGESEVIAGYRFDYGVFRTTDVYRNGSFITLKEAYEKGWLSKDDIRDVHYYHTKENASSKIDLSITRPALVSLTEEQELKIKEDYLVFNEKSVKRHEDYQNEWYSKKTPEEQKEYREEFNLPDDYVYKMTTDEVYIEEYFGTYNGCSVMMMSSGIHGAYHCALNYLDVAGYNFCYSDGQNHTVYRNGEFTTLERAYQKGWLSKDDIREIYYYYSTDNGIYYEVEYVMY